MNYWLVKSEPVKYPWEKFEKDGSTYWDGVRNYQARNNLMAMKKNDLVLFYHSNEGMEIVGIAKVTREYYQDPTTNDSRWVVVDLIPYKQLKKTVTLEQVKTEKKLSQMSLVKHGRLSVISVKKDELDLILKLAETKI